MELGAASAAASGKLRTHFTGAECAKGQAGACRHGRFVRKAAGFVRKVGNFSVLVGVRAAHLKGAAGAPRTPRSGVDNAAQRR